MRGGQTLCVLLLLSLTLQLAANNPCSRDIKQNVQSLMKSVTNQVGPRASLAPTAPAVGPTAVPVDGL